MIAAVFLLFQGAAAEAATTTCATVTACLFGNNASSGAGAQGASVNGHGLDGSSSTSFGVSGKTAVNATSVGTARAGVLGQDLSTNRNRFNSGVAGTSTYGIGVTGQGGAFGVQGTSTGSHGVDGRSTTSFGVVGATTKTSTGVNDARAGVVGEDNSTNGNTYNSGVAGTTSYGIGVLGQTTYGTGVLGQSRNRVGVDGNSMTSNGVQGTSGSGWGTFGYSVSSYGSAGFSNSGDGVAGFSNDTGLGLGVRAQSAGNWGLATFLTNTSSTGAALDADDYGAPGSVAILAVGRRGGSIFRGSDGTREVVSIDNSGNMILAGTLMMQGTPLVRTTSATGSDVATYGARTSTPTLDDIGESSLVNGAAYVTLDLSFAATIDRTKYLVFITPEGNSHGLYAADMTPKGFAVHENDGGRSSVGFAYRIVAHPLDAKTSTRLRAVKTLPHLATTPAAQLPSPVTHPSPIAIPIIPKVQ